MTIIYYLIHILISYLAIKYFRMKENPDRVDDFGHKIGYYVVLLWCCMPVLNFLILIFCLPNDWDYWLGKEDK